MDRQPQGSEFKINAKQMGVSLSPGAAKLELGERHPIALELAGLIVGRRPVQYQYLPSFEGILYGPEHLSLPLLSQARRAVRIRTAGIGGPDDDAHRAAALAVRAVPAPR